MLASHPESRSTAGTRAFHLVGTSSDRYLRGGARFAAHGASGDPGARNLAGRSLARIGGRSEAQEEGNSEGSQIQPIRPANLHLIFDVVTVARPRRCCRALASNRGLLGRWELRGQLREGEENGGRADHLSFQISVWSVIRSQQPKFKSLIRPPKLRFVRR